MSRLARVTPKLRIGGDGGRLGQSSRTLKQTLESSQICSDLLCVSLSNYWREQCPNNDFGSMSMKCVTRVPFSTASVEKPTTTAKARLSKFNFKCAIMLDCCHNARHLSFPASRVVDVVRCTRCIAAPQVMSGIIERTPPSTLDSLQSRPTPRMSPASLEKPAILPQRGSRSLLRHCRPTVVVLPNRLRPPKCDKA